MSATTIRALWLAFPILLLPFAAFADQYACEPTPTSRPAGKLTSLIVTFDPGSTQGTVEDDLSRAAVGKPIRAKVMLLPKNGWQLNWQVKLPLAEGKSGIVKYKLKIFPKKGTFIYNGFTGAPMSIGGKGTCKQIR